MIIGSRGRNGGAEEDGTKLMPELRSETDADVVDRNVRRPNESS